MIIDYKCFLSYVYTCELNDVYNLMNNSQVTSQLTNHLCPWVTDQVITYINIIQWQVHQEC